MQFLDGAESAVVFLGTPADSGRLWPGGNSENHVAMMEVQLVLATLVQRVTFDLVPGQQIVPEPLITLQRGDVLRAHAAGPPGGGSTVNPGALLGVARSCYAVSTRR